MIDVWGKDLTWTERYIVRGNLRNQDIAGPSLCILLIVGQCSPKSSKCFCGSMKLKDEPEIQSEAHLI